LRYWFDGDDGGLATRRRLALRRTKPIAGLRNEAIGFAWIPWWAAGPACLGCKVGLKVTMAGWQPAPLRRNEAGLELRNEANLRKATCSEGSRRGAKTAGCVELSR
jgi:hypothetical protein